MSFTDSIKLIKSIIQNQPIKVNNDESPEKLYKAEEGKKSNGSERFVPKKSVDSYINPIAL